MANSTPTWPPMARAERGKSIALATRQKNRKGKRRVVREREAGDIETHSGGTRCNPSIVNCLSPATAPSADVDDLETSHRRTVFPRVLRERQGRRGSWCCRSGATGRPCGAYRPRTDRRPVRCLAERHRTAWSVWLEDTDIARSVHHRQSYREGRAELSASWRLAHRAATAATRHGLCSSPLRGTRTGRRGAQNVYDPLRALPGAFARTSNSHRKQDNQ